jgi:hypothetical protein
MKARFTNGRDSEETWCSVSVSANTSLTNTGFAFLLTLSGPGGWGEAGQMAHA